MISATGRTGDAVPPRILSGRQTNRNSRPTSLSRLHSCCTMQMPLSSQIKWVGHHHSWGSSMPIRSVQKMRYLAVDEPCAVSVGTYGRTIAKLGAPLLVDAGPADGRATRPDSSPDFSSARLKSSMVIASPVLLVRQVERCPGSMSCSSGTSSHRRAVLHEMARLVEVRAAMLRHEDRAPSIDSLPLVIMW